jgi:Flp pilus assembly pilin Flp
LPAAEQLARPALSSDTRECVGAIEYSLIAALISVVAIAAMTSVGTSLQGTFNDIANKL